MKIKIIGLILTLLFISSCSSNQENSLEYLSQDTKFYESSSFEDVWRYSMMSIQEIGFMLREVIKDKGLLDAVGESESSPDISPPILNVIIIQELGQIKVNCLALMTGDQGSSQTTLGYVQSFFDTLDNYLKN